MAAVIFSSVNEKCDRAFLECILDAEEESLRQDSFEDVCLHALYVRES